MPLTVPANLQSYAVDQVDKDLIRLFSGSAINTVAMNCNIEFEDAVIDLEACTSNAERDAFLSTLSARLLTLEQARLLYDTARVQVYDIVAPVLSSTSDDPAVLYDESSPDNGDFSVNGVKLGLTFPVALFTVLSDEDIATWSSTWDAGALPTGMTAIETATTYTVVFATEAAMRACLDEIGTGGSFTLEVGGSDAAGNAATPVSITVETYAADVQVPNVIASSAVAAAYRQGETYPYVIDDQTSAVDPGTSYPLEWKLSTDAFAPTWAAVVEDVSWLSVATTNPNGTAIEISVVSQPPNTPGAFEVSVYARDTAGNFSNSAIQVPIVEGPDVTGPASVAGVDADFSLFGTGNAGDLSFPNTFVNDDAGGMQFRVRNATNTGPSTVLKVNGAVDNDTWYPAQGIAASQTAFQYVTLTSYLGGETFTLEMRDRKGNVSTESGTVFGP